MPASSQNDHRYFNSGKPILLKGKTTWRKLFIQRREKKKKKEEREKRNKKKKKRKKKKESKTKNTIKEGNETRFGGYYRYCCQKETTVPDIPYRWHRKEAVPRRDG